jgi:hypothetical protein
LGSDRTEKTWFFRVKKILPIIVPWDVSGLSFRAELGLQDLYARPSSKVRS